jgi:hypothetical protein
MRSDGSPKLAASVFETEPSEPKEDEVFGEWLDLPEEDFYQDPRLQLGRLYGRFREYYFSA